MSNFVLFYLFIFHFIIFNLLICYFILFYLNCVVGIGSNSFQILIDPSLDAQSLLSDKEKDRNVYQKHDDYIDNFNHINDIYTNLKHNNNIENIIQKK